MNQIAFNLVVLRTADLERASIFYECLGLRFIRHQHGTGPEHLAAEFDGCVFELYPQAPDGASTRATRIGFRLSSLDAVITALGKVPDAVIISPPQGSPWGLRAVVTDPDGHRIELVEA
ncbi:VOC family protein [Prosthecobacter sp.]|uniref:VOC family protein n=1 Tax=Prosthecobacter sp. TaxID=1965333 RepID=UPI003783D89E